MKSELQSVRADIVGFGKLTGNLVEIKHPLAVELLAAERHQSIVGAQAHRKRLSRRAGHVWIERVDGSTRDVPQRLGAGLRPDWLPLQRNSEGRDCDHGKSANSSLHRFYP